MKTDPRYLAVLFLLAACFGLQAQQHLTLYHMPQVPQSYTLNPGKIPWVKTYAGIPTLTALQVEANAGNLAYSDIRFAMDGNLHDFDFERLNARIGDGPVKVQAEVSLKAISFGTRLPSGFLHAEVADQVFSGVQLSHDIADLFEQIQRFNAVPEDVRYDFSDTELSGSYVRSYAVGYTHVFAPGLSAGIRAHYLEGMVYVRTEENTLAFVRSGAENRLDILGSIEFQAAGLLRIDEFKGKYLVPGDKPGHGFSVDLGVNYLLNDRIELSFSALNLGGITWKKERSNVVLSLSSTLAAYFQSTDLETFETGWEEVYHSLVEQGKHSELEKIKQSLPVRLYLGGLYQLTPQTSLGAVLQTRHSVFSGMDWGMAASVNTRLHKVLGVSGALQYNSFGDFGLGMGLNADLGPVQLYLVSDDLFTTLHFKQANYATAEVGLNLVFGKLDRAGHLGYYGYPAMAP